MEDCIFCKIAAEKMPAEVVYRDEKFVVFKDIHPKAPIHLLLIPKKHIVSVNHIKKEDRDLLGELFLLAQKITQEQKIADKGYKLVFNVGRGGGQLIDHLHLHLLAGWKDAQDRDIPGMP